MKVFLVLFVLFSFLFLTGCTTYDTLRHESFSVSFPRWEREETILSPLGFVTDIITTDELCTVRFTIAQTPLMQAIKLKLDSLASPKHLFLHDKSIGVSEAFFSYELLLDEPLRGDLRIMTCPSAFTYLVDYQCPVAVYTERTEAIFTVIDSMQC